MSRRRRIVLISAAVVLTVCVAIIGGIAALTQTAPGRAFIMRLVTPLISSAIPGRMYIGRVTGNLFTDIRVDSLQILEPDGKLFLTTGPIHVVYDPRDLLDRRVVIKSLEIVRPFIRLADYGDGDWSWKRALRRPPSITRLPRRAGSLGDYIVIDSITMRDAHVLAPIRWTLSDTLKGAKRDSAMRYNLTRMDAEIRRDGDHYVRNWRFVNGFAATGRARIADPDSAGIKIDVKQLDAIWASPPFWFRNVSGTFRYLGDSIWFDDTKLELTNSKGRANAKIVWGSDLPVRYDFRIKGDSVALSDLAWIDESLPRSGSGTMDIHIKSDPRDLRVIEYDIRNMNAYSMRSHLRGGMTFGVGGPVLRVTNVDLDLDGAHTDLLRQFNGKPFPYDWQGVVRGKVIARGGPIHRFQLDQANLSYEDANVAGAVSRGSARGMMNIFTPAEAILLGVDLRIDQLDLRTPRYVNPLFPELNGFIRGSVRLDSLWYNALFSAADIEHVDGSGLPSHLTGSGRYALLPQGVKFDVDMQAAPLSYTTLSRSYPSMPLRGSAVGRIRASGMAEDFSLNTILSGEGGELGFDGRVDAFEPSYRAAGTYRMRGVNLQSLLELSSVPQTTLTLSGSLDVSGSSLATLRGPLSATVDQFSRVADARLFGAVARVVFDSGMMKVDTLSVESSALRVAARGGLGLTANKHDSIGFTVVVDSLGGLRPWIAPSNGRGLLPANTDTLRGSIDIRGVLAGTMDTMSARGLSVRARADALGLAVGSNKLARSSATIDVADLLHGADGALLFTADSGLLGGVEVAAAVGSASLSNGLPRRFSAQMRTASEARVAFGGGVTRLGDTSTVVLDTFDIDLPSNGRRRGFSLLTPAIARVVSSDSTGRLDSLVLVHTDTGRINLRGGILGGGIISAKLDIDRLPLLDVGQVLRTTTLRGGSASLEATIGGTREAPRVSGTLGLRDALIGGVRLAAVNATGTYDSLRLAFDASLNVAGKRAVQANGILPLDLALVAGRTRLLEAPLSGRIVSGDADLSLLEALLPNVQNATGKLTADVALAGTWKSPRLRGLVAVENGAMTMANLGVRLEHAHADIALAGDTVQIRSLGATSGARGDTIGVSGFVSLADASNPYFDLNLAARNFLAIDKPREASLTVTTTTPISLIGSENAATVRGALRIDRGRVYIRALTQRRGLDLADNFDVIDTTALGMNALLPNAPNALVQNLALDNVTVEVGDDVWLRSPEANIKLGGALRVTRSVSRDRGRSLLALSDSLTVERGTYQLNLGIARPSFEVERGVIRFFGDPDLEPALDITALHTVRELRPNSNRQDVRIRVAIGGSTTQPTLTLSSADNPPLPESDMLSYLVTGEPAYALLGTPYSEQGATLLLRLASSALSSRLAGGRFDVVQVEPTALAPGDAANLGANYRNILAQTRVGVGGQLSRNTYFTFSTALCGLSPQAGGDPLSLFAQGLGVKVEWRLDHGMSLSTGVEPGSSATACGRQGISRTFQQTPPQFGFDLFRSWTF